jgi:hypothetical protein
MKTFKKAAIQILQEEQKPLHAKDITKLAVKRGYLNSDGKTPEATMNALLIVDVNKNGDKSVFKKVGPQTFSLSGKYTLKAETGKFKIDSSNVKTKRTWSISKGISSKQKGDITESRIAELISLYGSEALSCYKPISDDDGIDIIVNKKGKLEPLFVQVKSRFGDNPSSIFTATVKTHTLVNSKKMLVVFCFFDTEKGDLWDYVWLIPADEFIKKANKLDGGKILGFVAGRKKIDSNKWDQYLIEKNDLSEQIIGYLKIKY